jgi:hypothetical protein
MKRGLAVALAVATGPAAAAPPAAPMVATKALVRTIARDRRVLPALVDRGAGVVFIDHFVGPGDPHPARAHRLCGRAIDRQLRIVRGWLFAQVRGDPPAGELQCSNRPGPPQCTFGRVMEWDPAVHLRFRVDPDRGLVLVAIAVDDEVLVDEVAVAAEHRAQAALIARLRAGRCAP